MVTWLRFPGDANDIVQLRQNVSLTTKCGMWFNVFEFKHEIHPTTNTGSVQKNCDPIARWSATNPDASNENKDWTNRNKHGDKTNRLMQLNLNKMGGDWPNTFFYKGNPGKLAKQPTRWKVGVALSACHALHSLLWRPQRLYLDVKVDHGERTFHFVNDFHPTNTGYLHKTAKVYLTFPGGHVKPVLYLLDGKRADPYRFICHFLGWYWIDSRGNI